MMTNRGDRIRAVIAGFISGLLFIFPLSKFGVVLQWWGGLLFAIGMGAGGALGVTVFGALRRRTLYEFGKFATIGVLNTSIDLVILNILIATSGIADGLHYSVWKALAFATATVNSYFWNKWWAFDNTEPVATKEFGKFFGFSLMGAFLNVGTATVIVNFVSHPEAFTPAMWGSIAALIAVVASKLWNFFFYRTFVFRRPEGEII
ncbi:MAG: GtrA family protein [Candidatus Brennerbacteria bacterium]